MEIYNHERLDDFMGAVNEADIRLVKLNDYGFTEPEPVGGGAIGMVGKVRLVASAYDKEKDAIHRWEVTRIARGVVTVIAGSSEGLHSEPSIMEERRKIEHLLDVEGIQVKEGEWTEEAFERFSRSS